MIIYVETMRLPQATIGWLEFGAFKCWTLEPPWCHNKPDKSCIQAGRYPIKKHVSPKNGVCLLLSNVPYRTDVQVHAGNYFYDSEACIFLGDTLKDINGDTVPDVLNSRKTLDKLMSLLPRKAFIDIRRHQ